jgi:hypothetical protein
MSNKSKRARTKIRIAQQTNINSSAVVSKPVKSGTASKVMRPTAVVSSVATYSNRYKHIVPELTRIGIIAAVLFVFIVVLSFIIQ